MATIRETILSFPGLEDIDNYLENVVFVNRDLSGSEYYDKARKQKINLAAADMYAMIGGLPDFSENKLSIQYPREWYKQKANELYEQNGEPGSSTRKRIKVPRGRAPKRW